MAPDGSDAEDPSSAPGESPDVEEILESDAFSAWLDGLPSIELDGERLYLPTGDVPQSRLELAHEWLNRPDDHDS